jgi:L-lysine exporter family protein LysE/ArgO
MLLHGFLLYAGLVIAIGPQNLFVLRQGLGRRHLLVTALLCTAADMALIGVSVGGLGSAVAANQVVATIAALAGIAFLSAAGYAPCVQRGAGMVSSPSSLHPPTCSR